MKFIRKIASILFFLQTMIVLLLMYSKALMNAMVMNILDPRHLAAIEGANLRSQGIQCLIVHYLCVMSQFNGTGTLLQPLITMMTNPQAYAVSNITSFWHKIVLLSYKNACSNLFTMQRLKMSELFLSQRKIYVPVKLNFKIIFLKGETLQFFAMFLSCSNKIFWKAYTRTIVHRQYS
jgi:hypothetical protein